MGVLYVLYESSSGYTLFEVKNTEDIAAVDKEVQEAVLDMGRLVFAYQWSRADFAKAGKIPCST